MFPAIQYMHGNIVRARVLYYVARLSHESGYARLYIIHVRGPISLYLPLSLYTCNNVFVLQLYLDALVGCYRQ